MGQSTACGILLRSHSSGERLGVRLMLEEALENVVSLVAGLLGVDKEDIMRINDEEDILQINMVPLNCPSRLLIICSD